MSPRLMGKRCAFQNCGAECVVQGGERQRLDEWVKRAGKRS